MTAAPAMAKKKAGRKAKPAPTRGELVTMRCTSAFKAWLDDVSDKEDRLTSVVIERALRAYAEANGYDAPPDR